MTTFPPEVVHALAVAISEYHRTAREHEMLARAFADCELRLHACQRDLHELARIIETLSGQTVNAAELVSQAVGASNGSVTMPVAKPEPPPAPPTDAATEVPASEIVLQIMREQRFGG